jgi:integrase/recombinase XerD
MEAEIKNFLIFIKFEKGLAENTIISYKHDLEVYVKYVTSLGCTSIKEVNLKMLTDFFYELNSLPTIEVTQNRYLAAIRGFHKYLFDEKIIDTDITTKIELHKTTRKIPDILSLEDIDKLLETIDTSMPLGIRDKAMIEVFYACGMRVSELINLRRRDIFFDDELVRILGKGNKERIVPIGSEAIE